MAEKAPRTLHIELGRRLLGGTWQVNYLTRSLHQAGDPTLLITPESSPLHGLATEAATPCAPIRYAGDIDLLSVVKIYNIIRQFKPDIVHIHSRRGADIWGAIAARLYGRCKVVLARRVDDPVAPGWLNGFRYGPLCDRVVAVSHGIVRVLVEGGVPPEKIRQVYSAIEAQKYQSDASPDAVRAELGVPVGIPVLGVIAQLIPRKGHRFLIDAMPSILAEHPDAHVVFLGEGHNEAVLKQHIAEKNLTDRFVFAGYRSDVGRVLRAITLLIHPATMEGFANVAMQAQAAQVPVITADVGGMPESVAHEETGLVIPPENPAMISSAVNELLADSSRRQAMGAAGKARVESLFTVDAMVEATRDVYRELMDEPA
jgi:glycosyltransferase involved in cell wall biosynthesis